jgi:hypothetical protein
MSMNAIAPLFEVAGFHKVVPWQSDPQFADAFGVTASAAAVQTKATNTTM